jgi:hypothetical protein
VVDPGADVRLLALPHPPATARMAIASERRVMVLMPYWTLMRPGRFRKSRNTIRVVRVGASAGADGGTAVEQARPGSRGFATLDAEGDEWRAVNMG